MNDYIINVSRVEELQMISNTDELDRMFQKAKSAIVNGEKVILVRADTQGNQQAFDEFSTLDDLDEFRNRVFKYL
jgi:hypothetical protein